MNTSNLLKQKKNVCSKYLGIRRQRRVYLYGFCCLQRLFRRNSHFPLPQELLNKVSNIPTCNRNMFDATSNYVAFCLCGRRRENKKMIFRQVILCKTSRINSKVIFLLYNSLLSFLIESKILKQWSVKMCKQPPAKWILFLKELDYNL